MEDQRTVSNRWLNRVQLHWRTDFRVPNLVLGAIDTLVDCTQCGSDVTAIFNNILNLCEGELGSFTEIGGLKQLLVAVS